MNDRVPTPTPLTPPRKVGEVDALTQAQEYQQMYRDNRKNNWAPVALPAATARDNEPVLVEKREMEKQRLERAHQTVLQKYPGMPADVKKEVEFYKQYRYDTYVGATRFNTPYEGQQFMQQRMIDYNHNYLPHLSGEQQRAVHELESAGGSSNILSGITKNFWDEDKGGFQPGGFIGGLLGLAAGMFMLNSAGGGMGIMGLLVVAMTTIGFAYGGQKISEWMTPPPAAPFSPSADAAPDKAREPKKEPPAADVASLQNALNKGASPEQTEGNEIPNANLGYVHSGLRTAKPADPTPQIGKC